MGRARKVEDNPEGVIGEAVISPLPPTMPEKLKVCPRCEEVAPSESTQDMHGNWRCYCPRCGFWDSMVYMTPEAAAIGWNAAGGPNKY